MSAQTPNDPLGNTRLEADLRHRPPPAELLDRLRAMKPAQKLQFLPGPLGGAVKSLADLRQRRVVTPQLKKTLRSGTVKAMPFGARNGNGETF